MTHEATSTMANATTDTIASGTPGGACPPAGARTPPPAQTPRGFATVNYWADDVEAAAAWYAALLGTEPYFARALPGEAAPAYVEFRFGDYHQELGLVDRRFAPAATVEPGGAVVYWHVDDVRGTFGRLLAAGARALAGPEDRGRGFVTASVVDPFGNVLGVMHNPHYVQVLGARGTRGATGGAA